MHVCVAALACLMAGRCVGQPASSWVDAMRRYLNTPAADARDNALSPYVEAIDRLNASLCLKNIEMLHSVFDRGWVGNEPLAAQAIYQAEPCLALVVEACRKPFVRYPHWSTVAENPYVWPLDHYTKAKVLGLLLLLSARGMEADGRLDDAIDVYDSALTLARRIPADHPLALGHSANLILMDWTLNEMIAFMARAKLDPTRYDRIVSMLETHGAQLPPIWESTALEWEAARWAINHPAEMGKAILEIALDIQNRVPTWRLFSLESGGARSELSDTAEMEQAWQDLRPYEQSRWWTSIAKHEADLESQVDAYFKAALEAMKLPFPQYRQFDFDSLAGQLHPCLQNMLGTLRYRDRHEANVRILAASRLSLVAAAIHRYKAVNGQWPANIDSLGIGPEAIIDPFTEDMFVYRFEQALPILYSLGPDITDQRGRGAFSTSSFASGKNDIVILFE